MNVPLSKRGIDSDVGQEDADNKKASNKKAKLDPGYSKVAGECCSRLSCMLGLEDLGIVREFLWDDFRKGLHAEALKDFDGWFEKESPKITSRLIASLNNALAEKVNALAEKDNALAEIDCALAEKDYALAEKDNTIVKLKDGKYRSSLDRLIDLASETNAETSLTSRQTEKNAKLRKTLHLVLRGGASSRSHTRPNHQIASLDLMEFALRPITKEPSTHRLTSMLLSSIEAKPPPYEYSNEADVQRYVSAVLLDAAKYVNALPGREGCNTLCLDMKVEASIFSNKPDLLVVYSTCERELLPVLCVEIKKPSKEVFTSQKVAGQVYNYLMLSKVLNGNGTFGILTTFNQSKVAWNSDCNLEVPSGNEKQQKSLAQIMKENRLQILKEGRSQILKESRLASPKIDSPNSAQDQVAENEPPLRTPTSSLNADENLRTVSPPELVVSPKEASPAMNLRGVTYSKTTFESYELFRVFCNAIFASLSSGLNPVRIRMPATLKTNETVLTLRSTAYEWTVLRHNIKVGEQPWRCSDQEEIDFLVTSMLGTGQTSRAWLATAVGKTGGKLNGTGSRCVVKYWIRVWDEFENKSLSDKEIKEESNQITGVEVGNYKKIYHTEFFEGKPAPLVGRVQLNHSWCVILPSSASVIDVGVMSGSLMTRSSSLIWGILKKKRFLNSSIRSMCGSMFSS